MRPNGGVSWAHVSPEIRSHRPRQSVIIWFLMINELRRRLSWLYVTEHFRFGLKGITRAKLFVTCFEKRFTPFCASADQIRKELKTAAIARILLV
jgi:hypothetical protein